MTGNDFNEIMHIIACSEDSEKYYREISNVKMQRKIVKIGTICAAAIVAVLAASLIAVKLSRHAKTPAPIVYSSDVIIAATTAPSADTADNHDTVSENTPSIPVNNTDILSVFGPANDLSGNKHEWFNSRTINVKQLSYTGMNSEIKTLSAYGLGTNLISTEVFGEHRNCPKVFYNTDNDEIVCLYHEFLAASQITLNDGFDVGFIPDILKKDLFVVSIYGKNRLLNEGLWVFDRSIGYASSLPLPEGCSNYNEVFVYSKSLCNGKLSVGVNTDDGRHFVYVYNTESKDGIKLIDSERAWISAEFLSDRILLITNEGYSFYNVDTGKTVEVVGEYNYYADDKVFSIKNWGWASHNDVEVAAYDAKTGAFLDNKDVLVQTVLDDATRVFLTKNTTTGEETVILADYSQDCYTWTRGGKFFYAYSASNQCLLCYSAESGEWFLTQVPAINTEPMAINGKIQAYYVSYAISATANDKDVLLYYTRTIEEIPETPGYEDEKVDSPYWDKYREMKFRNFADEKAFGIAVKENIHVNGEAATIFFGFTDLEGFKYYLLSCLEKGTLMPDKQASSENYQSKELALRCGFLEMDFFHENGICYLSLGYHLPAPSGWITEIYEIPETLFDEINECCYNHMKTGYLFN